MKKKLLLWCAGLIMTAINASASANDINLLRIDSLNVMGNFMSGFPQTVILDAYNTTDTDYEGRMYLLKSKLDGTALEVLKDTLFYGPAGKKCDLMLRVPLYEGMYKVSIATDPEGKCTMAECVADIEPLRKLDIKADMTVEMLSDENGQYVLYSNSLKGSVSLANHDVSYYEMGDGSDLEDGIVVWAEDAESHERVFMQKIASNLYANEQTTKSFGHEGGLHDGGIYTLHVGYKAPDGLATIYSLTFKVRRSSFTYWTARGKVQLLQTDKDNSQTLTIPAEAAAVDLCGLNTHDANYRIKADNANPNCLYYLDQTDKLPEGLDESRNLIRNGVAETVKLTEGYDYFCPQAYKAKYISYMVTPSYNNPDDELRQRGYSETLVLPFNVSYANLYDINEKITTLPTSQSLARRMENGKSDSTVVITPSEEPMHQELLKVLEYLGNYGDSLNLHALQSVKEMQAYVPYILGVFVGLRILFVGEDTTVPMTKDAVVRGQDVKFVGTMAGTTASREFFLYDPDNARFSKGQEQYSRIAPFSAYMEQRQADTIDMTTYLFLPDNVWGQTDSKVTSIGQPSSTEPTAVERVYAMNGQHVANIVNGQPLHTVSGLRPGLYIVGKKKVVVKK